ncbi:hypothetical protein EDS67_10940 [candidate division KSB1 bacterium]|nr:MAG: hypothetical protein EDS67_10940 [candidate division KSB1 bacterium]MBC6949817.1 hypothetical protein [candidate division KSB1 bacterium]MCE7941993.1 hypothetical protein [Chlorobi bacterium CHB1]
MTASSSKNNRRAQRKNRLNFRALCEAAVNPTKSSYNTRNSDKAQLKGNRQRIESTPQRKKLIISWVVSIRWIFVLKATI